jgi:hypothetical protein
MAEKEFDLKGEYGKIKEKYNLPEFVKLSEDFDINKVDDKESTYLVRSIRRSMNEKISAYLHLLELFINPNSPPLFILSALRGLEGPEKESIKEMYKELSRIQVEVMKMDTIYDEKKEALFIINTFNQWQKIKPKMIKIIDKIGEGIEKEEVSKERGYFG